MSNLRQDVILGMCYIIPLSELRETPKVEFHFVPGLLEEGLSTIQRVVHEPGAFSPSIKGEDDRQTWYMHPHQQDNMLLLSGERVVDLYTKEHGKVETFTVTPDKLTHNGIVIYEGPCIFGWYRKVFHRPNSPNGSSSVFLIRHFEGFNLDTEFNIYHLDVETGEYEVAREGKLDQPRI